MPKPSNGTKHFAEAKSMLKPLGIPLNVAVAELVHSRKILPDMSLFTLR